ncbi:MAG: trypsin-like peptidase domain-containing protein [Thermodesulfobacteriota bacterium]
MAKRKKVSGIKKTERKLIWIEQELEVLRSVVPIIKADLNHPRAIQLLGTGFFVAAAVPKSSSLVVTAKHVLSQQMFNSNEAYCAVRVGLHPDYPNYYFYGSDVLYSKTTDLAAFLWPNPPDPAPLPLVRNRVFTSEDVLMVDFSRTMVTGAGTEFHFVMHKGNILCYYPSRDPHIENTPSFDTSFPALQGSSGAPVILHRPGCPVVGMIVSNVESTPIAAQTVRIGDGEPEVSYFLPTGHAIATEVIIEFLSSIGFTPQLV